MQIGVRLASPGRGSSTEGVRRSYLSTGVVREPHGPRMSVDGRSHMEHGMIRQISVR